MIMNLASDIIWSDMSSYFLSANKHTKTMSTWKLRKTLFNKKKFPKMWIRMTPAVNFINVLQTYISYKILAPKITQLKQNYKT